MGAQCIQLVAAEGDVLMEIVRYNRYVKLKGVYNALRCPLGVMQMYFIEIE